ncbi:MAG: sulfite exporter TauE/SafE family protein [Candidatus Omnitrophota bacterium]
MFRIAVSLFLSGLLLGSGPCLASCGPFLISFIGAQANTPKKGILIYLIFSVSRIFVYLLLGLLAGLFSQEIIHKIFSQDSLIFSIVGLFIVFLGLLIIIKDKTDIRACRFLNQRLIKNDTKSVIISGILFGISPCLPLIGIISYVSLISKTILVSVILMFCFGLGTLLSPLLLLSIVAGAVPKLFKNQERFFNLFKILCGLIIVGLGLKMLLSVFLNS